MRTFIVRVHETGSPDLRGVLDDVHYGRGGTDVHLARAADSAIRLIRNQLTATHLRSH